MLDASGVMALDWCLIVFVGAAMVRRMRDYQVVGLRMRSKSANRNGGGFGNVVMKRWLNIFKILNLLLIITCIACHNSEKIVILLL